MSNQDALARHEALMHRMANLNGADLSLAGQVGLISPEEVFAGVLACSGCTGVAQCEAQLADEEVGVPDYCRNSETIRRLASEMGDLGLSDF